MKPNSYLLTVIDQWTTLPEEEKQRGIMLARKLGESFARIDFAIAGRSSYTVAPRYVDEVVRRTYLAGGSGTGLYDAWREPDRHSAKIDLRRNAFNIGWAVEMARLRRAGSRHANTGKPGNPAEEAHDGGN